MVSVLSIIISGIVILTTTYPYVARPIRDIYKKIRKNQDETRRFVDEYRESIPLIAKGLVRIERGQDLSNFPLEEIPDPKSESFKRADKYLRRHPCLAIELDRRISELMREHRYGLLAV